MISRARLLYVLTVSGVAICMLLLLSWAVFLRTEMLPAVFIASFLLVSVSSWWLLRKERLELATILFLTGLWSMPVLTMFTVDKPAAISFSMLLFAIIVTGVFVHRRWVFVLTGASGVVVVLWAILYYDVLAGVLGERNVIFHVALKIGALVTAGVAVTTAVKVVRQALRQAYDSQRRYEALYEQSKDAIVIIDLELYIVDCNNRALELFGFSRTDFVGIHVSQLLAAEEFAQIVQDFENLLQDGKADLMERQLSDKDGRQITVEVSVSIIADQDGDPQYFQAILRNITFRKHRENMVRQAELRYRSIFQEAPISMWEEDFSAVKAYLETLPAEQAADLQAYFDAHPEALAHCVDLVKVLDVNQVAQQAIDSNGFHDWASEGLRAFLETHDKLFGRELAAFWQGQTLFEGESHYFKKSGAEKASIVRVLIMPGSEDTWERLLVYSLNISDRVQTERALAASEAYHRSLFENSPVAMLEEDHSVLKAYLDDLFASGVSNLQKFFDENRDLLAHCISLVRITRANCAAKSFFRIESEEELEGLHTFFSTSSYDSFLSQLVEFTSGASVYGTEVSYQNRLGEEIEAAVRISPVPGYEETWEKMMISFVDITARKRLEKQLRRFVSDMVARSRTDPLTGLLNRRALVEFLNAELNRSRRMGGDISLILVDLDFLKEINDRYGHQTGDEALQMVAEGLRSLKRVYDWAGRWGGDEFLIVLPGVRAAQAEQVAQRLLEEMHDRSVAYKSEQIPIRMSMGVTSISLQPGESINLNELLRQADVALYTAKENGRDRVERFP